MKEIIDVRSNVGYSQPEGIDEFKLEAFMELVIIHSNGKKYFVKDKHLTSKTVFEEIRLTVSPEMLTTLITELQLHQKKLEGIRTNADKSTALVKHIQEESKTETPK
jgi:hypothetical protein